MSTGGYQAPSADFSPTGFGSDSPEMGSRDGSASNIANAPLFGVDYKRWAGRVQRITWLCVWEKRKTSNGYCLLLAAWSITSSCVALRACVCVLL